MKRAGYEVVLVAPHDEDELRDGVMIRAVTPPSGRMERMIVTARRIVDRGLLENPDVLHIHDPELLPWLRFLHRGGAQVVYDMHENLTAQVATKDWVAPLLRRPLQAITRLGLRVLLQDIPVIFAERSYRDSFRWVRRSIVVQNMPLTATLFKIEPEKYEKPTVGYIGGVRPDRGSLTVLRALARLGERGLHVGWVCVGPVEPDHRRDLEGEAAALGVADVLFTGYLPPWEGLRRMARCHAGLALLRPTPNYVGSYPTKLFEYMALGLPVVVSDTPLCRKVVEDARCGFVVDFDDPESLAEALAAILENPERAEELGQRGRDAVRSRYNWHLEEENLLKFYEELLSGGDASEGGGREA